MRSATPEQRSITLRDGRALAFIERGDPAGYPVLFFPGFAMSAACVPRDAGEIAVLSVRLIAVDRPGIGESSPSPGRRLLDWPDDIASLTEQLGLGRFSILGWSAGGPHALACAARLPGQVDAIGLASCAVPLDARDIARHMPLEPRALAGLSRTVPPIVRAMLGAHCRRAHRNPDALIDAAVRRLCPADSRIVSDATTRAALRDSMVAACAQGPEGLVEDVTALGLPWGFSIDEIRRPIRLWHGSADTVVPLAAARAFAERHPRIDLTVLPGEGHFLYLGRWREFVASLAAPPLGPTR